MTSPLKAIDDLLEPMIKAALTVRWIKDNHFPPPLWNLIPAQIREPLDALFIAIENYERKVGILKDAGLMD